MSLYAANGAPSHLCKQKASLSGGASSCGPSFLFLSSMRMWDFMPDPLLSHQRHCRHTPAINDLNAMKMKVSGANAEFRLLLGRLMTCSCKKSFVLLVFIEILKTQLQQINLKLNINEEM